MSGWDKFERLLAIFGLFIFAWEIYLYVIGSFRIGFFDYALGILSQKYVNLGFVPYRDFAGVYPPGRFLLVGKLFYSDVWVNVRFLIATLCLSLMAVLYYLLFVPNRRDTDYLNTAVFFLLHAVIFRIFHSGLELMFYPYVIVYGLMVFYVCCYKDYVVLFIASFVVFIGVWVRWDWPLFYCLGLGGMVLVAFGLRFVVGNRKRELSQITRDLLVAGVFLGTGYLLGAGSLYLYLRHLGVWERAFEFFVVIPSYLTRTYRNLPLPWPTLFINTKSLIYVNVCFMALFAWWIYRKLFAAKISSGDFVRGFSLVLVTCPLVVVLAPYALGRSDWWHFVPMWYAIGLAWIVFEKRVFQLKYPEKLVILLAFLPLVGWYFSDPLMYLVQADFGEREIEEQIKDCRSKTYGFGPESIFVGRVTYERFLYNNAALYFVYPEVRPATAFITEEPGIQSSCKYGEMVVEDLKRAPRPMLTFLEEGTHGWDNEMVRTMSSCGKIESYLFGNEYVGAGKCISYGHSYEIRLYK